MPTFLVNKMTDTLTPLGAYLKNLAKMAVLLVLEKVDKLHLIRNSLRCIVNSCLQVAFQSAE